MLTFDQNHNSRKEPYQLLEEVPINSPVYSESDIPKQKDKFVSNEIETHFNINFSRC